MRGSFSGAVATVGGLCALLLGLAVIDPRVRDGVSRALEGRAPTGEIAGIGARLQEIALIVAQGIRDQSIEHAPMVMFALAAAVLVLFMTRT
jgi:hypothetical protein